MTDTVRDLLDQAQSAMILGLSMIDRARAIQDAARGGNVKPAPLFLGDKNASAILTGSAGLRMTAVPIAPMKLVDEVRPAEPATAEIVDWPDAPLPAEDDLSEGSLAWRARARARARELELEVMEATDSDEAPQPVEAVAGGPRPRGKHSRKRIDIDPRLWESFLADYNRLECPSIASCHARMKRYAADLGVIAPGVHTVQRRLDALGQRRLQRASRHSLAAAIKKSTPAENQTVDRAGDVGQAPEGTSGSAAGGAIDAPANACPPAHPYRRRKSDAIYYQAGERDARELEKPVDVVVAPSPADKRKRLDLIRASARRAQAGSEPSPAPRPSFGAPVARPTPAIPPNPFELALRRFEAATKFLGARGILVQVVDRNAQLRSYRVTGKKWNHSAEDVIGLAEERGFEFDETARV